MTLTDDTGQHDAGMYGDSPALASPTRRANRRRLVVFLGVFVLTCVIGLSFVFMRPAQYRADARVEITPASVGTPSNQRAVLASEVVKPFLTEVQVLTSRPVLEQAVARLTSDGYRLTAAGSDPVNAVQQIVEIRPVEGTHVVELTGIGEQADVLAPLLNAHIEAYREHLDATYRSSSGQALMDAEDEARQLEYAVAKKRKAVETFRTDHNIVSLEREENRVLSRVKGLATSLNTANERVAMAEGRLRSLQESVVNGSAVVRARDNPTLANLEQRASQIRERFVDLQRRYTAEYIALDPVLRAEAERLVELERQIALERERSHAAALAEAKEAARSARETADRLEQQVAADQQAVQEFTARFSEYKSLQEELTELQALHRASVQRVTLLQASEGARMPVLRVLEAATPPLHAWRPLYGRDAALVVGGAFVLGLLAMWFVELFNRQAPQPTMVVAQPFARGLLREVNRSTALPRHDLRVLEQPEPPLLAGEAALPRELDAVELAALMRAATDDARVAMLLLLSGLSAQEALALRWDAIDRERGVIEIDGESARRIALHGPLAQWLACREAKPGRQLLADASGRGWAAADLNAEILCAAYDAAIEEAESVTPAALRHTYLAFLVRQGIRFADLTALVGRLSAETMTAYGKLSAPRSRVPLEAVEYVMPGLQDSDTT